MAARVRFMRAGRPRDRPSQGHHPGRAGVFSAFGMLFSDLRYDYVRTLADRLDDAPFDQIERIYGELEGEAGAPSPTRPSHPKR